CTTRRRCSSRARCSSARTPSSPTCRTSCGAEGLVAARVAATAAQIPARASKSGWPCRLVSCWARACAPGAGRPRATDRPRLRWAGRRCGVATIEEYAQRRREERMARVERAPAELVDAIVGASAIVLARRPAPTSWAATREGEGHPVEGLRQDRARAAEVQADESARAEQRAVAERDPRLLEEEREGIGGGRPGVAAVEPRQIRSLGRRHRHARWAGAHVLDDEVPISFEVPQQLVEPRLA